MKSRFIALILLMGILTLFASAEALPASAQPQLGPFVELRPSDSSQQFQAQATLSGWFTTIWIDDREGKISEQRYFLVAPGRRPTRLRMDENMLRSAKGMLALNNKSVLVTGQWLGNTRTSQEDFFQVQAIQLDSQTLNQSRAEYTPIAGNQPWVSVLCKFADKSDEPKDHAYFQTMYDNVYPALDHYWREQSYAVADVQGSIAVGWYTLPQPRAYYVSDTNGDGNEEADSEKMAQDCTALAEKAINFPSFVGINLMFNDQIECNNSGSCFAWGGGAYLRLNGVDKLYHITWEPPWGYSTLSVLEHEMGHGFGLPHSSGNYDQTYDNAWDVMSWDRFNCGESSSPIYGCLGQHTIAFHKDLLGWIAPERKYVVRVGERATLTLEQLALPQTNSYLLATIPIGGSSDHFYTVETRRKVGYDTKLFGQAIIIHEVNMARDRQARVIDSDLNGHTNDDGAMWSPGETFTDSEYGIVVSIQSATATGFTVTIENQPQVTFQVSGRTIDKQGAPIPGVAITYATNTCQTTDSNGAYACNLPAGTYNFMASKPGYAFTPNPRTISLPPEVPGQDFVGVFIPAPASVSASDNTYTTHILVIWTASPGATGYKVYRNTTNDPSTATLIATTNQIMRYEDTSAVPGVTYNYWVKTVTAQGESNFSPSDTGMRAANWQSEAVNWRVSYGNNWTRIANITKPGATNIRVHFSQITLGAGDRLSTSTGDNWTGTLSDVYSRTTIDRNSLSVALFSSANGSGSFVIDRIEFQGTSAGATTWVGDLVPSGSNPTSTPTLLLPPNFTPTRTPTHTRTPTGVLVPTFTPTIVLPPTIPPGGQLQPTRTPPPVPTSTPVPSTAIQVNANTFAPNNLRIARGTSVTWRNLDTIVHTIVSGTPARRTNVFAPITLAPGQSFTFTFTTAGIYTYFDDKLGTQMQGTITVQ